MADIDQLLDESDADLSIEELGGIEGQPVSPHGYTPGEEPELGPEELTPLGPDPTAAGSVPILSLIHI